MLSFPTAIAKHPDKGVLIGEEAYTARDSFRVGLKSLDLNSVDLDNPTVREPIRKFVREILRQLLENRLIKGGGDTHFVVGCPSGWDTHTQDKWEALMRGAGLQPVMVLSESEANAAYAWETLKGRIPEEQFAGVLVVSVGLLTTEFISEWDPEDPIVLHSTWGNSMLGTSLLDKALLERAVAFHNQRERLRDMFRKNKELEAQCELTCRKAREKYFSHESKYVDEPAEASLQIRAKPPIYFDVELTRRDIEEVLFTAMPTLGGLSWPDAFREELMRLKRRMKEFLPDLLLLTGEGSRMGFVVKLCEEVFPNARVLHFREPETLAIAKGLAWAGRATKIASS